MEKAGRHDAIIEEGYPRNDALINTTGDQIAAIKERLSIPADKRVVLYAPTWRDDQHTTGLGYTFEAGMDFDSLQREFGDDTIVLFRAHYFIASRFDFARYDGFVRNVSDVNDVNDLYRSSPYSSPTTRACSSTMPTSSGPLSSTCTI